MELILSLLIFRICVLVIYLLLVFTLGIILCLLRPCHPNNLFLIGRAMSKLSLKILGIKIVVDGWEHLRSLTPSVLLSNHQGSLDIFLGAFLIPSKTVTVAKRSILYIPLFGQLYWLLGNIFIERRSSKNAKKSMESVTKKIKDKGYSVWILPEGTRSRGRGLLPFKLGAFISAIDAKVPLVPICISDYYGRCDLKKKVSMSISIDILKPIDTRKFERKDAAELSSKIFTLMSGKIDLLNRHL